MSPLALRQPERNRPRLQNGEPALPLDDAAPSKFFDNLPHICFREPVAEPQELRQFSALDRDAAISSDEFCNSADLFGAMGRAAQQYTIDKRFICRTCDGETLCPGTSD